MTSSSSTGVPTQLRVNDMSNPVGTPVSIYFGWHLTHPEKNQIQTQYQILVASSLQTLANNIGDQWDSGAITSRAQNHIAYAGAPLSSNAQYFWKVRYRDSQGHASPYSDPASFVVGLLANEDWAGAKWIRRASADADDYTYFRKRVPLPPSNIQRATVYISAVHKYDLYLNGDPIGTGPSYHYPQYQYYNAYDVTTNLIAHAENVIAVFTHWFGAGQGRPASARGLIFKLIVEYTDGTTQFICTDSTWKQTRAQAWVTGQLPRNDEGVGYVEKIDATKVLPNWYAFELDDSDWDPAIEIGAHPTGLWTGNLNPDLTRIVQKAIPPASISVNENGTYLVDLGKVYAGRPRIEFSGGTRGQIITLRGGYVLGANGLIDPPFNQNADLTYFAIANDDAFTFLPCEYLGMRYLQIENEPMPVITGNFTFLARYADLDETRSSFESSDATLNAVWDLLKYSVTLGAQEQFIDTPTREKGGFLVDSMNESLAAMAAYGERILTRKSLHEFLQSMEQYWSEDADRGRMNAVYPNGDGARDIPDFTQAFLVWVWEYYLQTGDIAFLRAHYQELKSIADYVHRYKKEETGLIHNLRGGGGAYLHGIIDWPPSMRYGYDMDTDARTVINCYAYADAEIIAKISAELGNSEDAQTYQARAHALEQAINTHLLQDVYVDGLQQGGTPSTHKSQQANAFPLTLGLVPKEKQQSVLAHIKNLQMRSGMVTVYWLIRALGEMEQGEHLLDLYTNVESDGWAKNLSQGATCTWESWDAHLGGNLSQSHPWGAVGLVGIQQYILGVKPLAPQYERVQVKPLRFGDKLTLVEGTVPTERGEIYVRWQNDPEHFRMIIELPVNMVGQVYIPCAGNRTAILWMDGNVPDTIPQQNYFRVDNVGSGRHIFETKRGEL